MTPSVLPPELLELRPTPNQSAALVAVLDAATAMTEDRARAIALMLEHPLRVFDGCTAAQLVMQGRHADVLDFLESLSAGSAG